MDITSLKKNILPNLSFEYKGKKYFYNKITSYDTNLQFEIKEGFYYNDTFINSHGDIYCIEIYFTINFGNEKLKIFNHHHIFKSVVKNKKITKSFLGIKYNSVDYDNEYYKILFTKGISSLILKYYEEEPKISLAEWCVEKFNCYNIYNNTLSEFNKFKQELLKNNIE